MFQAVYAPDMSCENAVHGPGVIIATQEMLNKGKGIHVLLDMARQMPGLLRMAAQGTGGGVNVAVVHTINGNMRAWRVFTQAGATDLAQRFDAALIGH